MGTFNLTLPTILGLGLALGELPVPLGITTEWPPGITTDTSQLYHEMGSITGLAA